MNDTKVIKLKKRSWIKLLKLSSFLGLILGVSLIFIAISSRGQVSAFLNLSSLLIVLGGTAGAILLSFNSYQLVQAFRSLNVVFYGHTPPPDNFIPIMVDLVRQSRVHGLHHVEVPEEEGETIEFLRKAVDLLKDGFRAVDAAKILKAESDAIASRYRMSERLFAEMGAFTPMFGLLGTLIGLISMLSSVADPKAIPGAMAVALITTFYGVLFNAMLFKPIATKIRAFNYDEILLRDLIIETLVFIEEGINSQLAEERLVSFFTTGRRA